METLQGTGTGFQWDGQGHVLINFDVIRDVDAAIHPGKAQSQPAIRSFSPNLA